MHTAQSTTTTTTTTTPAAPKKNCFEIYQAGQSLPGTYTLDLDTKVEAYCLPGGWTVIQSRGQFGNARDYFLKPWIEYEVGFGTPGNLDNTITYVCIKRNNYLR